MKWLEFNLFIYFQKYYNQLIAKLIFFVIRLSDLVNPTIIIPSL